MKDSARTDRRPGRQGRFSSSYRLQRLVLSRKNGERFAHVNDLSHIHLSHARGESREMPDAVEKLFVSFKTRRTFDRGKIRSPSNAATEHETAGGGLQKAWHGAWRDFYPS